MIILYLLVIVLLLAFVIIFNRQQAAHRANRLVKQMNADLREANKIKEEYISTFLWAQTEHMSLLEGYQRWVKRRAQDRRLEELQTVPLQFHASRTRREFYKQCDEMLLRIFPDFIENFNALLRPEEQLIPDKNELLTPEMRIFALIRLGVTDNEKIAHILDYSVNTIYTYKTRIRNKSDLSSADFDRAIANL